MSRRVGLGLGFLSQESRLLLMSRRGGIPTGRGSSIPRYEFGNSCKRLIGGGWETPQGLMDLDPEAS